ncbi:hypothetical protein DPMN_022077 [Dreissena polymorpha]|uniref:Uncharacterized protein n=1 Tax=Dreissena polymorpha TaxID=45954 RepID=A0A9D4NNV1_DREPO|nr:hypothetical protein DPMN_003049 [Dreissena polymorpha]KAH3895705.1 hypothetical protein DPMN_019870 [Dreissena polymorpha]KAH3897881.1 hypothetical protein DPMN_022077 [Dreissena polymorpha]
MRQNTYLSGKGINNNNIYSAIKLIQALSQYKLLAYKKLDSAAYKRLDSAAYKRLDSAAYKRLDSAAYKRLDSALV